MTLEKWNKMRYQKGPKKKRKKQRKKIKQEEMEKVVVELETRPIKTNITLHETLKKNEQDECYMEQKVQTAALMRTHL